MWPLLSVISVTGNRYAFIKVIWAFMWNCASPQNIMDSVWLKPYLLNCNVMDLCILHDACTYYVWAVPGVNKDLVVRVCFSLHLLWPMSSWSLWLTIEKHHNLLGVILGTHSTTVKMTFLLKPQKRFIIWTNLHVGSDGMHTMFLLLCCRF